MHLLDGLILAIELTQATGCYWPEAVYVNSYLPLSIGSSLGCRLVLRNILPSDARIL